MHTTKKIFNLPISDFQGQTSSSKLRLGISVSWGVVYNKMMVWREQFSWNFWSHRPIFVNRILTGKGQALPEWVSVCITYNVHVQVPHSAVYYTPGIKKIVPCNVTIETSQLAGKGYKESDYTFVIAIMQ